MINIKSVEKEESSNKYFITNKDIVEELTKNFKKGNNND
jgi:hypothetical protein